MSWQAFLQPEEGELRVLPWVEGSEVCDHERWWAIDGRRPREVGWYQFRVNGRRVKLASKEPVEPDQDLLEKGAQTLGYLIGDWLIPEGSLTDIFGEKGELDLLKVTTQAIQVFCVEGGLERLAKVRVSKMLNGSAIYFRQEWPGDPEERAIQAYQDRKDSLAEVPGVTPPLNVAFRWLTENRRRQEAHEAQLEELRRQEEERLRREAEAEAARLQKEAEVDRVVREMIAIGNQRRALIARDFTAAARAALAISGAELLDARPSARKGEMVVQYRYKTRRLECVCERDTLRIVDAGVCLDDHRGTKGDTFFTLESLPPVIQDAMNQHKLVVWRHAPGDQVHHQAEDEDEEW
jgi:hypothetical protein